LFAFQAPGFPAAAADPISIYSSSDPALSPDAGLAPVNTLVTKARDSRWAGQTQANTGGCPRMPRRVRSPWFAAPAGERPAGHSV